MEFEEGRSLEGWLRGLGRVPAQEELNRIVSPLLDALEMMHAVNFLHRDIAPDNIIIRPDGSPVLLDFGAARRAVGEQSHTLTGIVKLGYSPPEQYATDGRLQGPWTDVYALGATLYRAISGKPPEESTLRSIDDRLIPVARLGEGRYRPGFLKTIDTCLAVRHEDRPQSIGQLRAMLFSPGPNDSVFAEATKLAPFASPSPKKSRTWALAAVVVVAVLAAGTYAGFEYSRLDRQERDRFVAAAERKAAQELAEAESRRREEERAAAAREAAAKATREETEKKFAEAARKAEEQKAAAEREARRPVPLASSKIYSKAGNFACFSEAEYPNSWRDEAPMCVSYGCNFGKMPQEACLSLGATKGSKTVIHGNAGTSRANECWLQNSCGNLRPHYEFTLFRR
jgi:protein kinase-like protein